jgi:pSer/pThr/pTyr-binding forkhead associated (FHA) protein
MNDCNIRLEDNSLSRYHCFLKYTDNWVLHDGDGNKLSTNGTWLFAEDFVEIYDEMIFKVGESLLKAKLVSEVLGKNL